MKNHFFKVVASLILFFSSILGVSAETVTITLTTQIPENGKHDPSKFGHRLPPALFHCYINTDSLTISFSPNIEDVISYEIWNEEQTILIEVFFNDEEFINALLFNNEFISESKCIVINSESHTYIGFI